MLVLAHNRTYGIDYLITRSSNNYGLRQYEEKLIPKCIASIKKGKKIPIHGDGSYVRDWIYVKDNVDAIFFLIERGIRNDIINIAAKNYLTNLEVVKQISDWHGSDDSEYLSRVSFVENRWGQDLRYSVDVSKINSMGWKAKHTKGIHKWF
jgi:dTDP-glucose 4,6-dehydratase